MIYVLRKVLRATLSVVLVVSFVFVVLRVSGDPAMQVLPLDSSAEAFEAFRREWGLDRPILEQYVRYYQNIAKGNLGQSYLDGRDAVEVVMEKVPKTLWLSSLSFAMMLLLGIPMGVYAALHRNTKLDRFIMAFSVVGYSIPSFVLGILLILLFAVQWRLLPSSGSATMRHAVLPILTLGTSGAGTIARFTRSAMLEVLGCQYVRAAKAKGVPWTRVVFQHAFPNALIPVVTILGFTVGRLIAGSVVVETVFAWPGLGRLLVQSVADRDLAVVQVIVILIATTMVIANLSIDLLYGWLDPRIRTARTRKKQ